MALIFFLFLPVFKFQYDNTLSDVNLLIDVYNLLFKFQYDNTLR